MRTGTDHYKTEPGDNHLKQEIEEVKAEKPAKRAIPDFTKYPREFITYRWYRPIIVGILLAIFYLLFYVMLLLGEGVAMGADQFFDMYKNASGGYDTLDVYTASGAITSLGGVAAYIPALWLANLIAGRRTFKSYESSRGNGWDFRIFFKCLLIGLIVVSLPIVVDYIMEGGTEHISRFTRDGLICLIILGPMQCIGEEYAFRGFLMQTVGAWFKIPALAIVLPTIVFAAMHPYNWIGVTEIFISGCVFSIVAWASRGLEASSALHICNNMAIFIMTGLGYGKISSEATYDGLIFSTVIECIFLVIILIMRKRGKFDKIRGNDAAKYNAKIEKKLAKKKAKQAKKDAKAVKKEVKQIEKSGAKHAAIPTVEPIDQVAEAENAAPEAADQNVKASASDAVSGIVEFPEE